MLDVLGMGQDMRKPEIGLFSGLPVNITNLDSLENLKFGLSPVLKMTETLKNTNGYDKKNRRLWPDNYVALTSIWQQKQIWDYMDFRTVERCGRWI